MADAARKRAGGLACPDVRESSPYTVIPKGEGARRMTVNTTSEARAGMPKMLADKLAGIEDRLKRERTEKEDRLRKSGYTPEDVKKLVEEGASIQVAAEAAKVRLSGQSTARPRGRGMTSARIIEQAQLKLFQGEQLGRYTQFPIEPNSEYPSVLARVPIFVPGQRSSAKARLDKDLAMPFETGWGKGRKFGPPLQIYDEDTLLALLGLRQKQLVGMGNKMPVEVMNPFAPEEETQVQVVYTTISAIEEFLDSKKGGRGHKKRLASVKRLAGVVIEFTRISDPSLNAVIEEESFSTKLIDLVTQDLKTDSCLYIQFPPVMVRWLAESYTYIEMDIRRRLTDNGKAIHKFLASQQHFNIYVEKLKTITGTSLDGKNFMRALRQTMSTLGELDWCEYTIEGNGRRYPYKLVGRRLRRRAEGVGKVA